MSKSDVIVEQRPRHIVGDKEIDDARPLAGALARAFVRERHGRQGRRERKGQAVRGQPAERHGRGKGPGVVGRDLVRFEQLRRQGRAVQHGLAPLLRETRRQRSLRDELDEVLDQPARLEPGEVAAVLGGEHVHALQRLDVPRQLQQEARLPAQCGRHRQRLEHAEAPQRQRHRHQRQRRRAPEHRRPRRLHHRRLDPAPQVHPAVCAQRLGEQRDGLDRPTFLRSKHRQAQTQPAQVPDAPLHLLEREHARLVVDLTAREKESKPKAVRHAVVEALRFDQEVEDEVAHLGRKGHEPATATGAGSVRSSDP